MIRQAKHEDIVALAELWARAFPGERTVDQRVRHLETGGVFGGIEAAWIAEQQGRTVGAFRGYALTQYLHGTRYRSLGLAAVAVDETARRRGIGRMLCEHAVRVGRERGDVLSILYPFRPAFYEALGWGFTGEMHAFRFRPESLRATGGESVRRATPADTGGITACYARAAEHSNGLIARTQRIWRSHLEGEGTHVYVVGDQRVQGYAIVRYGRSSSPDERPLHVREIIAQDHDTYNELLGWLSAQRDTWRLVHYEAPRDERFEHRLIDPRPPGHHLVRFLWSPVARVIRGPMLRVLDVPAVLSQRVTWRGAAPVQFTIEIDDRLVPENRGPFAVDFDGDRAAVRAGSGAGGGPTLRFTAPSFAQVLVGELTLREAMNLGVVESSGDASAVDALFRTDRCFRLLDEF